MLTPVEIENKVFKSGGLGYDKKDVDVFMREVADSYSEVYKEKLELEDKMNVLNEALGRYKSIEKTMQKALILAEKTAEEEKAAALVNARQIENDAVFKAQNILSDARRELDGIKKQILTMRQIYETYKVNFKNLANAQIELLNSDSFNVTFSDEALDDTDMSPMQPVEREEVPDADTAADFSLPEGFDFINPESVN